MMREIKFRAWDKSKELLVNAELILGIRFDRRHQEPTLITYTRKKMNPTMEVSHLDKIYCNEFELMQYTGLKDRNGTDIYEGDVLKRGDFPDEKPEFIVRFGQFTDSPDFYHELEYSGWYAEKIGERDKYNTSLVYVIEMLDGIVCGNIYEGDNQ